jgi:hypothetical protein
MLNLLVSFANQVAASGNEGSQLRSLTVNTGVGNSGQHGQLRRFAGLSTRDGVPEEYSSANEESIPQRCIIPGRGMIVSFDDLEDLNESLGTMKNSMEQAMRILDDVLSINKVRQAMSSLMYFQIVRSWSFFYAG